MKCLKCNHINPQNAINCLSCKSELFEQELERDYCPSCNNPLLFPDKPCPHCNSANNKSENKVCPGCQKNLNKGIIFSNCKQITELESLILNIDPATNFCDSCFKKYKDDANNKLDSLILKFEKTLDNIIALTVEEPLNLKIVKYCQIVSSQAIVNINKIQEFANNSYWNNPNNFQNKMNLAEKTCLSGIKKKALQLGANAIINADIEYAQLNSHPESFIVAMMGTAVVIEEFEILSDYEQKVYNYLMRSGSAEPKADCCQRVQG